MHPGRIRSTDGFTLIELMLTVAVLGILLAIALPAVSGAYGEADSKRILNALSTSITQARNGAINYDDDALLCTSNDGVSCSGSTEWHYGWIVGVDLDHDNNLDADDSLIEHVEPFNVPAHVFSTSGRSRLQFQPYGSNGGSNVTFTVCDRRGSAGAAAYALNNYGQFHEVKPKADRVAQACAGL